MLGDYAAFKTIPRFWRSQAIDAQPWASGPSGEGLAGCEVGEVLTSTESKKD